MRYFKEEDTYMGHHWEGWSPYDYYGVPEDEIYEGLFEGEFDNVDFIYVDDNDSVSANFGNFISYLIAGEIIIIRDEDKCNLPEKYSWIQDSYDFDDARGELSRKEFAEKIELPIESPDDWECHEVWVYWDGSNFCGKTLISSTDLNVENIEEITKEEYEKATGGKI
ncbi:MAG: hypothetical protein K9L31_02160 [Candidatus Pacebacteria bacterium]|nr:hypothetical protein [Candidatus Paceibacterota bacterium]